MKPIHELAKATMQGSCGDSPKPSATPSKIIIRVFAVLAAQYGSRWTSLIQNEESESAMARVWGDSLDGIEPMRIKHALDELPKANPNWPPTLGQFIELCNIGKSDLQEFKSLPRPEGDPILADEAFRKIWEVLK